MRGRALRPCRSAESRPLGCGRSPRCTTRNEFLRTARRFSRSRPEARPLTPPGTWSSNQLCWIRHLVHLPRTGAQRPSPLAGARGNTPRLSQNYAWWPNGLLPLAHARGEGCSAPARGRLVMNPTWSAMVRRSGAGRGEGSCLRPCRSAESRPLGCGRSPRCASGEYATRA